MLKFFVKKHVFSASPGKTMQNHLEILFKSQFWIRNVEIRGKHKENIFLKNAFLRNKYHISPPDSAFRWF